MSVEKLLLWEKWRPKTMDDIILLPRIRKFFEEEVTRNYIFYGNFGTGKTSLGRILIGRYTKDKPYVEINCSLNTTIETLRNEIGDFCKFTPMMEANSDIKYVFLDEFERVSANFQDGFKAFMEKYHRNVRFIMTTNEFGKINKGIKSRTKHINFDANNLEEEKYLKQEIYKKITKVILPSLDRKIPKADLISIITKKFPDFRATIEEIDTYLLTDGGETSTSNISIKVKMDLYNTIYDKSMNYEKIYHFLMTNFGADKIDAMIKLLGKPFIDFSISEKKDIEKLFECNYIIADYSSKLETSTDPIILGLTILGKFRDLLLKT